MQNKLYALASVHIKSDNRKNNMQKGVLELSYVHIVLSVFPKQYAKVVVGVEVYAYHN